MREPAFWANPPDTPGPWARLLAPLGALYAGATARRVARAPTCQPKARVICVGNLNAGGTGKTPTVIALAQLCADMGLKAAVISRGYGAKVEQAVQVDPLAHSAGDVGDDVVELNIHLRQRLLHVLDM